MRHPQKRFVVNGYDPRYGRFHFETESHSEACRKAVLYSQYSTAEVQIEDLDTGKFELYIGGYPIDTIR